MSGFPGGASSKEPACQGRRCKIPGLGHNWCDLARMTTRLMWLNVHCMSICFCLCMCLCIVVVWSLSHVQLFATPWTVAYQASLSMRFPRQEYWSGLSFPSSGDLPHPGTEPVSPALAGIFFPTESPGKLMSVYKSILTKKFFLIYVSLTTQLYSYWNSKQVMEV